MTWTDWLNTAFPFVSAIAVILTAVASLLWSQHYRDAKNAQIETLKGQVENISAAKDVQIETLQTHINHLEALSPPKLQEIAVATTALMEQEINRLQQGFAEQRQLTDQLAEKERQLTDQLAEKERQLQDLKRSDQDRETERIQLEEEKDDLKTELTRLQRAQFYLAQALQRQPTPAELGTAVGMTETQMERWLQLIDAYQALVSETAADTQEVGSPQPTEPAKRRPRVGDRLR